MQLDTLNKNLSTLFVGTALFITTFCVAEEDTQKQSDHVQVGDSSLTHKEWVSAQESRYRLIQKIENGEECTEEEKSELSDEELTDSQENIQNQELVAKNSSQFYTTHNGAFHHPIAVYLFGEQVELEDGSIWQVASSDRNKTLDWMSGDTVIILPNNSLFSSFQYRLINLNTSAGIKVNLKLGPILNGLFTHWIVGINYVCRQVWLEDGSEWKISSLDDSILAKWLPNHTVIIGINSGWLSNVNPNILINVNENNYIIGGCVQ